MPLLGGIVYVFAALFLKRAGEAGAETWQTIRVCNWTAALAFQPLLLLGGTFPGWHDLWQPAVVALLFVAGQVSTVLALKVGDVSLATPVLGIKMVLVAALTALVIHEWPTPPLWTAAILSSIAVALLNLSPSHQRRRANLTIAVAVFAAFCYALFDVLVQKWSPAWGTGRFLPVMMAMAAGYSVFLRPWGTPASAAPESRRWLAIAAVGLATQALLIITPIALYGQATTANVLYSARGMWSVLIVWLVGHWFGNREQTLGRGIFITRLIGAALMTAAVIVVVLNPIVPPAR
jgi:drug/metabolite transporter (DMT)-like permease